MIRWQNRLFNIGFAFFVRNCRGKQESPLTFLLSNQGKGEKNRKRPFSRVSEYGGRLWKGKVLAPFPSVVFHELLEVCSFFKCFVLYVFENVLKNALVRRTL